MHRWAGQQHWLPSTLHCQHERQPRQKVAPQAPQRPRPRHARCRPLKCLPAGIKLQWAVQQPWPASKLPRPIQQRQQPREVRSPPPPRHGRCRPARRPPSGVGGSSGKLPPSAPPRCATAHMLPARSSGAPRTATSSGPPARRDCTCLVGMTQTGRTGLLILIQLTS